MAGAAVRLTLYGRNYCHLCEDMRNALADLVAELEFSLEVIDVDRSEALEARYGERVPVLAHGETELCHHFLDRRAVVAYLARIAEARAR